MNLDLKPKRKPRNALDKEKAMELWDQGKMDKEICAECNVSEQTVKNWRHRNKLPINKANGTRSDCYGRSRRKKHLSQLEMDAIAARQAGMTYGQYKARQREDRRDYFWEKALKRK